MTPSPRPGFPFRGPLRFAPPSPTWGVRWVAVYAVLFLAGVIAVVAYESLDRTGYSALWDVWRGRKAALRELERNPEAPFLLGSYEATHVDLETGLAVAFSTMSWDCEFEQGWNQEMRAHAERRAAPRRYDGIETDATAVLRRFERHADRVVEWTCPDSEWRPGVPAWAVTTGGVRLEFEDKPSCTEISNVRIRGASVPWGGTDSFGLRGTATAGGALRRTPRHGRWLTPCGRFRVLASDDGRFAWLVGRAWPPEIPEGRTGWWTATIDVERARVVAVDLATDE